MGFALGIAFKLLLALYLGTIFISFLTGLFGGRPRQKSRRSPQKKG